ncbi:MAG: YdcF family protein [Bacteroidales bacterium]|nr:YdcF family protein [Bacteroidales bacterium]
MFFYISKIASYLLAPVFWILLLMVIALLIKNPRRSKRFLLFTVIFTYLLMNHFIVDEFMRKWEVPVTPDNELAAQYPAGIVLGGDIIDIDKSNDRLIFRSNADRLLQAVDLYKEGRIKKIIVSGGSGHMIYTEVYEAAYMEDFLVDIGIPAGDILVDSVSNNTHQNAINTKELLGDAYDDHTYLLITSAVHMKRALACYEKVGFSVKPYSTNKMVGHRLYNYEHLFVPNLDSLIFWRLLIHEYVGYLAYWIMGYV